MSDVAKNLLA